MSTTYRPYLGYLPSDSAETIAAGEALASARAHNDLAAEAAYAGHYDESRVARDNAARAAALATKAAEQADALAAGAAALDADDAAYRAAQAIRARLHARRARTAATNAAAHYAGPRGERAPVPTFDPAPAARNCPGCGRDGTAGTIADQAGYDWADSYLLCYPCRAAAYPTPEE
jgi:hypothetical protein